MNDVRRAWPVRDAKKRISQATRRVNQLRVDTQASQCGMLQDGSGRNTSLSPERTNHHDAIEPSLSVMPAEPPIAESARTREIVGSKFPFDAAGDVKRPALRKRMRRRHRLNLA
jgi:hypothetical protein